LLINSKIVNEKQEKLKETLITMKVKIYRIIIILDVKWKTFINCIALKFCCLIMLTSWTVLINFSLYANLNSLLYDLTNSSSWVIKISNFPASVKFFKEPRWYHSILYKIIIPLSPLIDLHNLKSVLYHF
jgi:hypothetical protein